MVALIDEDFGPSANSSIETATACGISPRIAELLGHKVHLELFVRITPQWKSMPRQLAELGYEAPVGLAKVEASKKPTRTKNKKRSAPRKK